MGYLDNSSITVDAVLTKKGREILKNGGSLNITSFTMSDTGVDYTMWNPNDSRGTTYYGEAIENLPQLEASVHAEYNLRNRLISLNQNTVAIPALTLGGLDTSDGSLLTLEDGNSKVKVLVDLVGWGGPSAEGGVGEYYYIVQDPSIVSGGTGGQPISGTGASLFLSEQDIPMARMYYFGGDGFTISALQQDEAGKETHIYVVHSVTGAYNSFRIINNVTKNQRAILTSKIIN